MIVVISDLHFEEEASDAVPGRDGRADLVFRRNLDAKAYRSFIAAMAEEVRRRRAQQFDLVIAGDLFDFNRTTLWFTDELRPYVPLSNISYPLEAKILKILEATVAEAPVAGALETFRLLARGRYKSWPLDSATPHERDFPCDRISLHYLVGNHDRLSNSASSVRRRIRSLLGSDGEANFPYSIVLDDPPCLVRHGHEYDPANFAVDLTTFKTIAVELPVDWYAEASFGDFITIDIAGRLPFLLRRQYGDSEILSDPVLSSLYLRLLAFDDVRPQSALLDYLLDTSTADFSPEDAWERLVPIIEILLNDIHADPFFRHWLKRQARPWAPAELEVARGLLKLGGWRNRAARELARILTRYFLGGETERPELLAQREELVRKGSVRLVLAGHTHSPQVTLLGSDRQGDRYYVNTGTWRNRIPATPDGRRFGTLKALTYAMLFKASEERSGDSAQLGSFEYWTGYDRHWIAGG